MHRHNTNPLLVWAVSRKLGWTGRNSPRNIGWARDTAAQDRKPYLSQIQNFQFWWVCLFLLAFVWKCGRLATLGKTTIESVPPSIAEGGSVLLLVHNPPENILGFVWFKGRDNFKNIVATRLIQDMKATVWGPAYSGRETLHSDGSLLLNRVTQKDSGLYTLRILRTDAGSEYTQVQLQVDSKWFPVIVWCLAGA